MNTTPPNNGPRNNGPGSNGPGNANQDPRWDALDDAQPQDNQPFQGENPYGSNEQQVPQNQLNQQNPQNHQHPQNQQGQFAQQERGHDGPYGQVNNGGQNPYAQNAQGPQGQQYQQQPGQPAMNGAPGAGADAGAMGVAGPAGATGPGAPGAEPAEDPNKKKGTKGALIAAVIGGAMVLGIGGFAACQAADDEDSAAETSQSQPADTTTEESAAESTGETSAEESTAEDSAEASGRGEVASDREEMDPNAGRPAGTVPFDELEDGDEITLGEGLGPYQTWGTYNGTIVRVPEAVDDPGEPSNDLELAKEYAVYYAYQDLKSKAEVTKRLEDTTARYMQTFTPEVAQKAVDESDIDWNAIALAQAKKYKERWPDDPNEALFTMLVEDDLFTGQEAQYAIDNLGR